MEQHSKIFAAQLAGEINFEVYKKALLKCLSLVKSHQVVHFLIDQRALEYVGAGPQAWLSFKWFPALESLVNEPVYFAIISSKKLFVKLASQTVSKQLNQSAFYAVTQYFDNEIQALNWLENPEQ